jgi:hypothetical protein
MMSISGNDFMWGSKSNLMVILDNIKLEAVEVMMAHSLNIFAAEDNN